MIKIKFCMSFCLSLFIAFFPVLSVYSQEGIASPAGGLTAPAPYVKPGNVTMNFKNADIRAVLLYLSEVSGVDIIPAPEVAGSVTLKLTDKPWQVALNIIAKNYGYAYERDGDIIRVVTLESLKLEELSTEVVPLNYASAEIAETAVKDMLTTRGKMTFDSRVNALVITDLATNIYKMKQVIEDLDKKTPQIMIEAKIIETMLNDTERLGIDWNLVIAARGAKRPTTLPFSWRGEMPYLGFESEAWNRYMPRPEGDTETNYTDSGGAAPFITVTTESEFPLNLAGIQQAFHSPFPVMGATDFIYGTLDFTQFSAVLEYLKSRSDTDIVSSPRITTLNNKEAKMFVGRVHPYISKIDEDEEKGRIKYEYAEKEIGVRLLVLPHVNEAGDIEVKLKPEIKDIVGYQTLTQWFSLPVFSTREAETQVMIRDGDTIFIGGLIKENINKYDKKFPILGDLLGEIPFIGNVFKYETETKTKTELVFFLTVHVVKDLKEFNTTAVKDAVSVELPLGVQDAMKMPTKEEIEAKETKARIRDSKKKFKKREENKPIFDFTKPKSKNF